jgi:Na+-transporting methylmalonyl-CoA/oxaloacetate decarboxylase gamma subunit
LMKNGAKVPIENKGMIFFFLFLYIVVIIFK